MSTLSNLLAPCQGKTSYPNFNVFTSHVLLDCYHMLFTKQEKMLISLSLMALYFDYILSFSNNCCSPYYIDSCQDEELMMVY